MAGAAGCRNTCQRHRSGRCNEDWSGCAGLLWQRSPTFLAPLTGRGSSRGGGVVSWMQPRSPSPPRVRKWNSTHSPATCTARFPMGHGLVAVCGKGIVDPCAWEEKIGRLVAFPAGSATDFLWALAGKVTNSNQGTTTSGKRKWVAKCPDLDCALRGCWNGRNSEDWS